MTNNNLLKYQTPLNQVLKTYLDTFCERQDCVVEHVVGDLSDDYSNMEVNSLVNIADAYFNIYDIILDVKMADKVVPGIIFIWYWDNLIHRDLNYESAIKAFRTDSEENFKYDLTEYRNGTFGNNPLRGELNRLVSEITEKICTNQIMISAPIKITDLVLYINEVYNGEHNQGDADDINANLFIGNVNKVILWLEGEEYDISNIKFDLTLFSLSRGSIHNEENKKCLQHLHRLIVRYQEKNNKKNK